MIVSFTGHRPEKVGGYELPNPTYIYVCQQIESKLLELKPEKIISGMALGIDQWAANIAIKLGIPFIAAVPFKGQENMWPEKSKKTFNKLLSKAERIEIVCQGGYAGWKLQKRNEWMVDNSDQLIAVWDGTSGGTSNCISYANSINRIIHRIDPKEAFKNDDAIKLIIR